MSSTDQVLSEFIDAWNAGERPRAREYLARVPEGRDRDELADQITIWLETAPAPVLSAAAREQVRGEPAVQQVYATVGSDAAAWPAVLPRLRERAGLSVRDVAARVVDRLGLGDETAVDKAASYVAEMEAGDLGADRVSRRVLDALGSLLGVSGGSLADLGRAAGGGTATAAAAGGTLFRRSEGSPEWVAEDIEVLSMAAMAPAPEPMDPVDLAFRGGPDA